MVLRFFFEISIVIFTIVYSEPYLNKPVPDQFLERFESFEFTVPIDTFESTDEYTMKLSLSSHDWLNQRYVEPTFGNEFGYYNILKVFVVGDFLYLLDLHFGLRVLDIVDLTTDFSLVGRLEFEDCERARDFFIDGDYAYVQVSETTSSNLKIISIEDPTNPILVGTFLWEDCDPQGNVVVSNDYAYVTCQETSISIVDVSVKSHPRFVGETTNEDNLDINQFKISVKEDYIYEVNRKGLYIIDARNKTHPEYCWKDNHSPDVDDESVWIEGNFAFVGRGGSSDELVIFNISTPCSPVEVSRVSLALNPGGVIVYGNYAYVYYISKVVIVDISNISSPFKVSVTDGGRHGWPVNNDYFFLAVNPSVAPTLALLDSTNKTIPFLINLNFSSYHSPGSAFDIALDDEGPFMYVAQQPYTDPRAIDVFYFGKDGLEATYLTTILADYGNRNYDVFFRNNHLYLGVANSDIVVVFERSFYNNKKNINLTEIKQYQAVQNCPDALYVDKEEKYLYVMQCDGFDVIDLSNGSVYSFSDTFDGLNGAVTKDGIMYSAVGEDGILIVKLIFSDDPSPSIEFEEIGYFIQTGIDVSDVVIPEEDDNIYAYVAAGTDGLVILNISDPYNPVVVGKYDTVECLTISVDGDLLAVSDLAPHRVKVFDVSDRTNPTLIESIPVLQPQDVIVKDNIVYVANSIFGIRSYHLKLKIVGKENKFSHFCGTTEVEISAIEIENRNDIARDSFQLSRDDYCSNRGRCLPNTKCSCRDKYEGDNCETWKCGGFDFKQVTKVCSGHGDCTAPEVCDCQQNYVGDDCGSNILGYALGIPLGLIGGMGLILCLFFLCCLVCFLCCVSVGLVLLCFCGLCSVVIRQKKGIEKFGKLKNFDLLLKEQQLEENASVAHLRINRDLFKISYDEIELITILGEGGSSSVVYKARWNEKIIAFKCFKTRAVCSNQNSFDEFEREVEILGSVSHPNILQFFGCTMDPPRVGIVMEFCEFGDIDYFLKNHRIRNDDRPFDFRGKLRFCHEIILPMQYLHTRKIIHRDLKLENVLVDKNLCLKLMDFGLSKIVSKMSQVKTKKIGTSYFMAPELLKNEYDEKVDVFAFGICSYILLTEEFHPYGVLVNTHMIELRVATDPNLRPDLSVLEEHVPNEHVDWLADVMKKTWDHDPKNRPPFSELSRIFKERLEKIVSIPSSDIISIGGGGVSGKESLSFNNNNDDGVSQGSSMKDESGDMNGFVRIDSEEYERLLGLKEENQKLRSELQKLKEEIII